MSYIFTQSGRKFHYGDHEAMVEAICIEDIAHALSQLCRFTGQCSMFYSVAEHSYAVSYLVPEELALQGLLHDATEAYVADLAKPLKGLLPQYQHVEQAVWDAVAEKFKLPFDLDPAIKAADMMMLKKEVRELLPEGCLAELDLPGEVAPAPIFGLNPLGAKTLFLNRFRELTDTWID